MKIKNVVALAAAVASFAALNVQAYFDPSVGRFCSRDPSKEQGGLNLYCFVRNDSVDGIDLRGLGTWTHNVNNNDTPDVETEVYYTFDSAEKCKCNKGVVDRYVKKLFGIWPGLAGDYYPDSAGGGGFWDPVDQRAYAEGDGPDGPLTIWPVPWHKPWGFAFKWKARCADGPSAGNILSTSEGLYYTSGHLSGYGYFGIFYIYY